MTQDSSRNSAQQDMTTTDHNPDHYPLLDNELDLLAGLVPLAGQRIIELGCGNARLARELLERHADSEVVGLEVDAVQHAKNLSQPQERLQFLSASAEAVPFARQSFDGALMLKSLHHVPIPAMDRALACGEQWEAVAERRFAQPVHYPDWPSFAQRMLYPSFADHQITPAIEARARRAFEPHLGADGARFVRPMHVRLLRRRG